MGESARRTPKAPAASVEERNISEQDQLKLWRDSAPDAPYGPWYKNFGSIKVCGEGRYPKTFLLRGQAATGERLP